jgi:hypothetical protein
MPTFLADPPPAVYVTLILALLVVGGLWVRYRRRVLLLAATLVLACLLLVGLVAALTESPREQAVRKVKDMAQAVSSQDWAKFSEHVSESFNADGLKKGDLRGGFDLASRYGVRAAVWDFALTEPVEATDTRVVIRFDAKAEARTGEQAFKHFHATFEKDPDGQLRLRSFAPFNYVQKTQREPIPGLGR